jgi:hypothetical protein
MVNLNLISKDKFQKMGFKNKPTVIALGNLCRANLLTGTPHLKGLRFTPYLPTTTDSREPQEGSSDNMSVDENEKEKIPTDGKVGAGGSTPS